MTAKEMMIEDINLESSIEEIIAVAATEYYSSQPSISDEDFDKLVEILKNLNPNSEIINKTGWGYEVPEGRVKEDHKYGLHIGSLGKIHSTSLITSGAKVITPKLDGLSVVAYFTDGKFTKAITRGDGYTGIDITNKISAICSNEFDKLVGIGNCAIRGEIIVSNKDWNRVKEKYPDAKNPRNFASGIINRNTVDEEDIKFLSVVFYNLLYNDTLETYIDYDQNYLAHMFNENYNGDTKLLTLAINSEDKNFEEEFNNFYKKCQDIYPIDGLVVTDKYVINDNGKFRYNQIAFKFPSESKDCKVKGIEWTVTRTGNITPVVEIETVELSGTNVSRVTGFNAKYIEENKINTGAIVNVKKANEIIPYINYVVTEAEISGVPTECPVCHGRVAYDGVHIKCVNNKCLSKDYLNLKTFVVNISKTDNIGWTLISKFFEELNINSISDLFRYGYNPIDDRGQKQRQLFNSVLKQIFIDPISVVDALCALNIPRLGRCSAEKLSTAKEVVEECILEIIAEPGYLIGIHLNGLIAPSVIDSIKDNQDKFALLDLLWKRLVFEEPVDESELVEVCITGKLSVKRSEFESELKEHGYISKGINKNTKFLITDDPNSGSSKNKKADELGIQKITELEFREKFMK